jgi:TPP-dependent 2-oxoacid decarboxylase
MANEESLFYLNNRGYNTITKVLHTATILYNGWELDNYAWIVEWADGSIGALDTNHGGIYEWSKQEALEKLAETEASAESIRKALEMWPAGNET